MSRGQRNASGDESFDSDDHDNDDRYDCYAPVRPHVISTFACCAFIPPDSKRNDCRQIHNERCFEHCFLSEMRAQYIQGRMKNQTNAGLSLTKAAQVAFLPFALRFWMFIARQEANRRRDVGRGHGAGNRNPQGQRFSSGITRSVETEAEQANAYRSSGKDLRSSDRRVAEWPADDERRRSPLNE